jgi:hypothetical protein
VVPRLDRAAGLGHSSWMTGPCGSELISESGPAVLDV